MRDIHRQEVSQRVWEIYELSDWEYYEPKGIHHRGFLGALIIDKLTQLKVKVVENDARNIQITIILSVDDKE